MKLFAVAVLAAVAGLSSARPRYIAIPVDDIQFLNFAPADSEDVPLRIPRDAPQHAPQYLRGHELESASSDNRPARQAHHGHHGHHGHHHDHDYVDFGAHTGHHGAFGWYADYPVHSHEH